MLRVLRKQGQSQGRGVGVGEVHTGRGAVHPAAQLRKLAGTGPSSNDKASLFKKLIFLKSRTLLSFQFFLYLQ